MARLSASLPLRQEPFRPSQSAPYFEGLLPEGSVRATIAESGSVRATGSGCSRRSAPIAPARCGAAEDHRPGCRRPQPRPLGEGQLGGMIRDLPRDPLGVDVDPAGVRLSLGGIQHKLILVRPPGEPRWPIEVYPAAAS